MAENLKSKYKSLIEKNLIFMLGIVVVFILGIQKVTPLIGNLDNVIKQLKQKETEIVDLQKKYDNLLEQQKLQQEVSPEIIKKTIFKPQISTTNAVLPLTDMLEQIMQFVIKSNLKLKTANYIESPEDDIVLQAGKNSFNVCKVDFALIGEYASLKKFLNMIYAYPYLINISKINIIPYEKDKRSLIINLSLNLYSQKV